MSCHHDAIYCLLTCFLFVCLAGQAIHFCWTWGLLVWTFLDYRVKRSDQGPVSRKSRKLFGPDKPFVKLRPAYSVKLVFSYVVKGIKVKITAKFRPSRGLCFEDTKRSMSPEMRPKSFGTFEKQAPEHWKQHVVVQYPIENEQGCDRGVVRYTATGKDLQSLKDGAYYCYCAYVLRTSRYSGFLSVMLTNTEIFLRGLKLSGKTGSY